MIGRSLLAGALAAALSSAALAQAVRTQPYNAQLPTDPAVGNIQGIQRYGRPLATDPDEGDGFSYHVYPVQRPSTVAVGAAGGQGAPPAVGGEMTRQAQAADPEVAKLQEAALRAYRELVQATENKRPQEEINQRQADYRKALKAWQDKLKEAQQKPGTAAPAYGPPPAAPFGAAPVGYPPPAGVGVTVIQPGGPASPYPPPFNSSGALRASAAAPYAIPVPAPGAVYAAPGTFPGVALAAPGTAAVAAVAAATAAGDAAPPPPLPPLTHQPLIQVKMRVVEVDRSKLLQATSVLDFIRMPFAADPNTLVTGNNINRDRRNLSGGTRFPLVNNLINFSGNNTGTLFGTGALVNLTTGNLNFIARLLEEELHADTITAPEVVTLNGHTVEFVAGQKVPFELGQNVIQGNNNNIQQFFYKHIGTYISVTPQIVNWGNPLDEAAAGPLYGGGGGTAPLTYAEVPDWNQLVKALLTVKDLSLRLPDPLVREMTGRQDFLIPMALRTAILRELNQYAKEDLVRLGLPIAAPEAPGCDGAACGAGRACRWRPEDCTIDLAVVMRLSNLGMVQLGVAPAGSSPQMIDLGMEDNVRAIANIVQVKSGHGVVMGGLISEHEVKDVDKVPVLGDIPVVGALFRSKSVNREKTEVLLFIEAQVLDPCPPAARAQSAHDFTLGRPFVAGDVLDNPLEFGMYRAGFGPYLPPHSAQEKIFWERLGRRVRNVVTTIDDVLE